MRRIAPPGRKFCALHGRTHPIAQFGKMTSSPDGHSWTCRAASAAAARSRRARDKRDGLDRGAPERLDPDEAKVAVVMRCPRCGEPFLREASAEAEMRDHWKARHGVVHVEP